jgi:hypothetical protein
MPTSTDIFLHGWRASRSPADRLARLIRKYKLPSQALEAYAEVSRKTSPSLRAKRQAMLTAKQRAATLAAKRRAAIRSVVEALRPAPWDYVAAEKTAATERAKLAASSHALDRRIGIELEEIVIPLLKAYEDPRAFFRNVAPRLCQSDFAAAELKKNLGVGFTLERWGVGALWHPDVQAAFDEAEDANAILTMAHRRAFRKKAGRPRRIGDSSFIEAYTAARNTRELVPRFGRSVVAVEKRWRRLRAKMRKRKP